MEPFQKLPDQMSLAQEQEHLKTKSNDLLNTTKELNNKSAEYRLSVSQVNDKIILLSGGSVSLLLTFTGVLFGSNKDTSDLNYKFLVLSLVAFTTTMTLLLISKWCRSIYVFKMVAGHYLENKKEMRETELKIASLSSSLYGQDNKLMSKAAISKFKTELKKDIKRHTEKIEKNNQQVNYYDKSALVNNVLGLVMIVVAYTAAIIFFLSVIKVMNR